MVSQKEYIINILSVPHSLSLSLCLSVCLPLPFCIYIYIYIYREGRINEYIFRCFKDDHLRCIVFSADFGRLPIISALTASLTSELPGRLPDSFMQHNFLLTYRQTSYLLLSTLANGKSSFSHHRLYKGNYTLHPFRFRYSLTAAFSGMVIISLFTFFSKFILCIFRVQL